MKCSDSKQQRALKAREQVLCNGLLACLEIERDIRKELDANRKAQRFVPTDDATSQIKGMES